MWPHYDAVAKKCAKLFDDYKSGQDITKYATKGDDKRVVDMKSTKRSDSPLKQPDMTMTSKAADTMKSATLIS